MTTPGAERDPEVPEADALEQAQPVGDAEATFPEDETLADDSLLPPMSGLAPDVPEADALEQALAAGDDGDDWYDERS
jgi:hypothetical protein